MRGAAALSGRLLALCFLAAFVSLAVQLPSLAGRHGVSPARATLAAALGGRALDSRGLPKGSPPVTLAALADAGVPSVAVPLAAALGLPLEAGCELVALAGIAVALGAALARPHPPGAAFGALTLLYLGLSCLGGVFLAFQWDALLLEAGAAATLAFPLWVGGGGGGGGGSGSGGSRGVAGRLPTPGRWLLRLLAAKLLFQSGVVKLTSGCPTWSALTATEVHFASQCLPTPVAWWLHSAPPLAHRVAVAATLWLEIPAAVLLLVPGRLLVLRRVGVAAQLLLQILIAASGNYAFFNLLTAALVLAAWPERGGGGESGDGHADDATAATTVEGVTTAPPPPLAAGGLRRRRTDATPAPPSSTAPTRAPSPRAASRARPRTHWLAAAQWAALAAYVAATCRYMFSASLLPAAVDSAGTAMPWHARVVLTVHPTRMSAGALEAALSAWLPHALHVCGAGMAALCTVWWVRAALGSVHAAAARTRRERRLAAAAAWLGAAASIAGASAVAAAFLALTAASLGAAAAVAPSVLRPGAGGAGGGGGALHPSMLAAMQAALPTAQRWHLVTSYGLFRRMTGVGPGSTDGWGAPVVSTERPELELQGLWASSDVGERPADGSGGDASPLVWRPIPLPFKPGDPAARPRWVAPHQPRLDWQFWFAALAPSYQHAPWLVRWADAVACGLPDALALADIRRYPAVRTAELVVGGAAGGGGDGGGSCDDARTAPRVALLVPPRAVRVVAWVYDFTRPELAWARGRQPALNASVYARASGGVPLPWWQRRLRGSRPADSAAAGDGTRHDLPPAALWLPPVAAWDPSVAAFQAQYGWARPRQSAAHRVNATTLPPSACSGSDGAAAAGEPLRLRISAALPPSQPRQCAHVVTAARRYWEAAARPAAAGAPAAARLRAWGVAAASAVVPSVGHAACMGLHAARAVGLSAPLQRVSGGGLGQPSTPLQGPAVVHVAAAGGGGEPPLTLVHVPPSAMPHESPLWWVVAAAAAHVAVTWGRRARGVAGPGGGGWRGREHAE